MRVNTSKMKVMISGEQQKSRQKAEDGHVELAVIQ